MDTKLILLLTFFIVLSAFELAAVELKWNDEDLASLEKVERKAVLIPYCTTHAVRCGPPTFMSETCVLYRKVCPVIVG
ncbi:unnamed protein product [Diamesa serratosioi]